AGRRRRPGRARGPGRPGRLRRPGAGVGAAGVRRDHHGAPGVGRRPAGRARGHPGRRRPARRAAAGAARHLAAAAARSGRRGHGRDRRGVRRRGAAGRRRRALGPAADLRHPPARRPRSGRHARPRRREHRPARARAGAGAGPAAEPEHRPADGGRARPRGRGGARRARGDPTVDGRGARRRELARHRGLRPGDAGDAGAGYTVRNYAGYPAAYVGDITLRDAIAQSCNSALVNARNRLSAADLADAAASLGLGQPLRVDWPAFTGSVPAEMTETELAASLIGQGDVLASPLAMATGAATIQAGEVGRPRLVVGPSELADEGALASETPPHPLTAEEAETLAELMRAVVDTGTARLLQDVPGEPVHAKTGSAEAGEGDEYR